MSQASDNSRYSVSVVIPAYNAENYISRTIKSVLAQTRRPDEIIIVDDGSSDNTAETVRTFGDKVILVEQENSGASVARNTGIETAKSEWIAFLDADDEWMENKLERQMSLLERNRDLMWAGGNYITFLASTGQKAPRCQAAKVQNLMDSKDSWDDYFSAFANGVWGWTGTMIIHRNALRQAGMFRQGQKRANDLDMWFRVACLYPEFGFVCEPTAVYYLEIAESITQKQGLLQWQEEFLDRHIKNAKEHGRLEAFQPCVTNMLQLWIRGMLFDARAGQIRTLLSRFGYLLPLRFRITIRILTIFPRLTRIGCLMISKIVRALKLRRQVVRKPKR